MEDVDAASKVVQRRAAQPAATTKTVTTKVIRAPSGMQPESLAEPPSTAAEVLDRTASDDPSTTTGRLSSILTMEPGFNNIGSIVRTLATAAHAQAAKQAEMMRSIQQQTGARQQTSTALRVLEERLEFLEDHDYDGVGDDVEPAVIAARDSSRRRRTLRCTSHSSSR